jgi:hypothetical protein
MNIIEEFGNPKIKAEAGDPCLIPRKTLKGAETHPLFRIHPFISV